MISLTINDYPRLRNYLDEITNQDAHEFNYFHTRRIEDPPEDYSAQGRGQKEPTSIKEMMEIHHAVFLASPKRYVWLSGGVGTGKSYLLARWVIMKATQDMVQDPKSGRWERSYGLLFANSKNQLSQSTIPHLLSLLDDLKYDYCINDSKTPQDKWGDRRHFDAYNNVLAIRISEYPGDVAYIFLRSLDRFHLERGKNLGWAAGDEICDARGQKQAWDDISDRLRCPYTPMGQHQLKVVGMPNGWDYMAEYFLSSDEDKRQAREIIFMSVVEATHLSASYVNDMFDRLDPIEALRRAHGRIVANQTGKIYHCFDRDRNVKKYDYDPGRPIVLCFDFNIMSNSPISAVLCQEWYNDKIEKWEIQIFDEIVIPNADTVDACQEFARRYQKIHQAEVWIFGDYSGAINASISEYELIEGNLAPWLGHELKMIKPKPNPRVDHRVSSVNACLRNAAGNSIMFIDLDRCPELVKDFEFLAPKAGKIDKGDLARSHTSDALGYYILRRFPSAITPKQDTQIATQFR